jgi:hypothetical protein
MLAIEDVNAAGLAEYGFATVSNSDRHEDVFPRPPTSSQG